MKKLRTAFKVLRTFGWTHTYLLVLKKIGIRDKVKSVNLTAEIDIKSQEDLISFLQNKFGISDDVLSHATKLIADLYENQSFSRSYQRKQFFDESYDFGKKTGFITTSVILHLKPKIVLETGVAAGLSSSLILKALANLPGKGKLVSVDITEKCGELIPTELKKLWELKILKGRKDSAFQSLIENLESCDLFIHDSDHSLTWQNFEISTVLQRFPLIRVIIVDDPTNDLLEKKLDNFERVIVGEDKKISAIFVRS